MEKMQPDDYTAEGMYRHRHLISPYYFHRSKGEVIIGLISALVVSALLLKFTDQDKVLAWLSITLGIYLIRYFFTPSSHSQSAIRETSYLGFTLLLFFCGLLWGGATANGIVHGSEIHKFGLIIWVICLCFLICLIYSGRLSLILAFCVPALGIPAFMSYTRVVPAEPEVPIILLGSGAFLLLISAFYRYSFLASLLANAEHEKKQSEHQALSEKVKQLEVELKTTIQNHEAVVKNMSSASVKLEQCQSSKQTLLTTLKSNLKIDPVTDLVNRNTFKETLHNEWQRAVRNKESLSLAYINVDNFNDIEKKHEKSSVFKTLKKIGASIKSHGRRAGDLPARLDNANFALLLVGADSRNSEKIVENIRQNISTLGLPGSKPGDPITVHAGVATLVPTRSTQPETLFERVESALYEAQFQGGDRVIGFHNFTDLEITKWDHQADGNLNETNFQQKLLSKGYATKKESLPAQTSFRDQSFTKDTLFAVFEGVFKLTVEGRDYELRKGHYLILPANIPFSGDVIGDEAVTLFLEKL